MKTVSQERFGQPHDAGLRIGAKPVRCLPCHAHAVDLFNLAGHTMPDYTQLTGFNLTSRHSLRCSVCGQFIKLENVAGSDGSYLIPDPVICEKCYRKYCERKLKALEAAQ